eukprot:693930-Pyramimonas_sp.AAC.1
MIRAGKRDAKDPRALRPRDVDGATIQRERFWLLKRHVTTHAPDHLPTRCLVRKAICTRRRVFCGSPRSPGRSRWARPTTRWRRGWGRRSPPSCSSRSAPRSRRRGGRMEP